MSLERIRERNRCWLAGHGLLTHPWFILGSAPDPTVPTDIASRANLVCINNAGATAARLGLPPAKLTVRNTKKEWNSVAGCTLPLVLWMSNANPLQVAWTRRFKANATVGEMRAMSKRVRAEITAHVLGNDLNGIGNMHKPSTGIFTAVYGLFVGAPGIILGGVSMDKHGYSYGLLPGIQLHRDEDLFAMKVLAERDFPVRTTERDVAAQTGIPLYRSSA